VIRWVYAVFVMFNGLWLGAVFFFDVGSAVVKTDKEKCWAFLKDYTGY